MVQEVSENLYVSASEFLFRTCKCIIDLLEYSVLQWLLCPCVDLQYASTKSWNKGDRNEEGTGKRYTDRYDKVLNHDTDHLKVILENDEWDEYTERGQRGCEDCIEHVLASKYCRYCGFLSHLSICERILKDNDRRVNDHTDTENESAHTHEVD